MSKRVAWGLEAMKRDIGEFLVEQGLVTGEQLQQARVLLQQTHRHNLLRILVYLGFITEPQWFQAKAAFNGLPYVDLNNFSIDPRAVDFLNFNHCLEHMVLPVQKQGRVLVVAIADPDDVPAEDYVRLADPVYQVQWVVAPPAQILEWLLKLWENKRV